MLTEFLLTPDAICDSDGRNGTDVVRELKNCLFPFSGTPIALICNLGGDDWVRAVSSKIARIPDGNHRSLVQNLFMQIVDQLSVSRPVDHDIKDDESSWVSAGIKSSALVPLGKIVVSGCTTPPPEAAIQLRKFTSHDFWKEYRNPRLVSRNKACQEDALRAICTHSDWIVIRLPQIRGGCDDEIVTAKQIIQLANGLPTGFSKTKIDLHLCLRKNIREENLFNGVSHELKNFTRQGIDVTLTLFPAENKILNREIIGGEYTATSQQNEIPKPLWWITMAHVAVGSRNANDAGDAGNTWSLFSRAEAHNRFEEINKAEPLKKLKLN